ncbi:mycothiol transferase [Streptomyces sp. NBC_01497]|uniref:mycothiol transferase n=1 Tax=Streptomyces sp. NBC_01497 TaxID=2903885 RepID=UPI002E34EB03|nr:DUF664 domain-containing protein [Streptomyces sp. NBC_01497]
MTTERDALCAFLDKQRAALTGRLDGLTDAQAGSTPTASSLSLLGLLKHAGIWERRWFQVAVEGTVFPGEWPDTAKSDSNDEDFVLDASDTVERWRTYHAAQVAQSRRIATTRSLDAPCAWPPAEDRTLRWVLLHMIEETARHAGHADIIRETLDGTRGV